MSSIKIVNSADDEEIFGTRYGTQRFIFTKAHIEALQSGKILALDFQEEYLGFVYLKTEK